MDSAAAVVRIPRLAFRSELAPGLVAAAGVGVASLLFEALERAVLGQPIIEALVAAIIVGMIARNVLPLPASIHRGTGFAAKQILEVAVFLFGATVDLRQVLAAGPVLLLAIAGGVFGGIAVSFTLGRLLGLPGKLALLVAVGNSICGNSAIAAVAPVIRAEKKDVASSIGLTAIVGVVLILSLPVLVSVAHLTYYQYGVVAGMTVYSVPQVIAASYPVSQLSGQVATLVKLVRVLFLGPVVLLLGLVARRRGIHLDATGKQPALVPWFVAGFLVFAALRFVGLIPAPAIQIAQDSSRLLFIIALAGLGLGVEFAAMRKVGRQVTLAVAGSLAFLICLSLTLILVLRIAG